MTEVAMEDCYYHRSVTTLKSLARISGVLIGLCHVSGLEVTIVNPNTWKSGMLVLNGSKPSRRADQKAAASPRCHDEADAVCLAEWAQRTAAARSDLWRR